MLACPRPGGLLGHTGRPWVGFRSTHVHLGKVAPRRSFFANGKSTSASTGTGGFYASFAMPAPEPSYSHNCAGYYSSRGLGKTMVLSAFIVVLLIGASYRGDPAGLQTLGGPSLHAWCQPDDS